MMLQHQQMLYQQIQQEQQNYMMQMNEFQFALQAAGAPANASQAAEEADMEQELEKFTNGVAGGGDDGQDRKAKAKMSKIEKLFERPADASEDVQDREAF